MAGELDFHGRTAVITGAGRGMGRAYALLLASRGASVVVNDLGGDRVGGGASSTPANEVVEEIRAAGGQAVANHADVADPASAPSMVSDALDAFGGLDIVICNAGINRHLPFGDIDFAVFEQFWRVHTAGAFNVTRAAWPHLVAQGYGRVIMITSGAGTFGMAENAHYSSAKAAVNGLLLSLAAEGGPLGISVNGVAPAAFTRMSEEAPPERQEEARRTRPPELVAPVVGWLAHEDCTANGEIFSAAGGRIARVFTAETVGWTDPALTIESVRDHVPEIYAEDGYVVRRGIPAT